MEELLRRKKIKNKFKGWETILKYAAYKQLRLHLTSGLYSAWICICRS